ncbi:MAG: penicillin acylase family protein [Polyangiales bacterium]
MSRVARRLGLLLAPLVLLAPSPSCENDEPTVLTSYDAPQHPIEVIRDGMGIPHIYGRTDYDALFGAGYVQAVDRLFQMDLMRRNAYGRAAEVEGPSLLAQDRIVRTIDIPRWGRESARRVEREYPRVYSMVVAWTAGVNRRIAEVRSGAVPLPYGFRPSELDYLPEPWSPEDAFVVSRLINFQNGSELDYDALATYLRSFAPDVYAKTPLYMPFEGHGILPPEERPVSSGRTAARVGGPGPSGALPADAAERFAAHLRSLANLRSTHSNNWAMSGAHTANGRSLIAGDPHQPLRSPSLFFAHHVSSLQAGGNLDVIGFGFVGSPGVQLGHNRRVAWTATVAYPDITDLVAVASDGERVTIGSRQVAIRVRPETIAVRGQGEQTIEVQEVPGYGVILPGETFPLPLAPTGYEVLLQWTGYRATVEAASFFGFDVSRSASDFERALDTMDMGSFNFVYADASNIGYGVRCLVPDRGDTTTLGEPWALLDGDQDRSFWTGAFLPRSRMPSSHGGARGWLTTSNNDPFGFTANGRVDDDPWYYGAFFDPGTRHSRLELELDRLATRGEVTVEDFETLQLDTESRFADALVPLVESAYASLATDASLVPFRNRADLDALRAELAAWDRRYELDSRAAVVGEAFMAFLSKRIMADELGALYGALLSADPPTVLRFTGLIATRRFPAADDFMQEGRDFLVLSALSDTAAWLVDRFGGIAPDRRTWSDVHVTHFQAIWGGAPLDGGKVPTRGSNNTVSVGNSAFFDTNGEPNAELVSDAGSIYRMVATFDADGTPRAQVIFPRGQSGEPGDPRFADLEADYVAGHYRPLVFRAGDVEASATERFTIEP